MPWMSWEHSRVSKGEEAAQSKYLFKCRIQVMSVELKKFGVHVPAGRREWAKNTRAALKPLLLISGARVDRGGRVCAYDTRYMIRAHHSNHHKAIENLLLYHHQIWIYIQILLSVKYVNVIAYRACIVWYLWVCQASQHGLVILRRFSNAKEMF